VRTGEGGGGWGGNLLHGLPAAEQFYRIAHGGGDFGAAGQRGGEVASIAAGAHHEHLHQRISDARNDRRARASWFKAPAMHLEGVGPGAPIVHVLSGSSVQCVPAHHVTHTANTYPQVVKAARFGWFRAVYSLSRLWLVMLCHTLDGQAEALTARRARGGAALALAVEAGGHQRLERSARAHEFDG
jgi:hypothetical protein